MLFSFNLIKSGCVLSLSSLFLLFLFRYPCSHLPAGCAFCVFESRKSFPFLSPRGGATDGDDCASPTAAAADPRSTFIRDKRRGARRE